MTLGAAIILIVAEVSKGKLHVRMPETGTVLKGNDFIGRGKNYLWVAL
jgi:hypothetical protein